MYRFKLYIFFLLISISVCRAQYPFNNPSLPIDKRVNDLLDRLTTDEKISLLLYNSPGVERLDIPAYNWWNEALHGVGRAGRATVFPQAIGMAATFNDALLQQVGNVISNEARAKYNMAVKNNNRGQYLGLTFWSPNINIFRDPRWGRGHETYGEDPLLTSRMGTAFVKGMQGDNPRYYKTVACAKHFAVHSGPEHSRHSFNAVVSDNDLHNTYLPAFKKLVTDAKVGGVMCAYNRLDSLPCCGSPFLLQDLLRKEWGFKGYLVTDCWALDDIFRYHQYVKTPEEAAAIAIKNGVNVECGNTLSTLQNAIKQGLLTETDIDASLYVNLEVLMKLGWFDKQDKTPYAQLGEKDINNDAGRQLARKTAAQSMVLLKNSNNTLPLSKSLQRILVTGPNADDINALLANYNGNSGNMVTVLEGITNAVSSSTVIYHNRGCDLTDTVLQQVHWMTGEADAVVAVMGLSPLLEGENGDAYLSQAGGDKNDISFPYAQLKYLQKLKEKTKKPLVVVLMAGSAIELSQVETMADAVLLAWYPGEEGGNAVADILFGKINPAGRLPVTFYQSNNDLPAFEDYSMKGRTYRYFGGEVQHPFGFGLSYTRFSYSGLKVLTEKNGFSFQLDVQNTGKYAGDEVVQLYIRRLHTGDFEPLKELKDFKRVSLAKGETKKVNLHLNRQDMAWYNDSIKKWIVHPGEYEILIGGSSEDKKLVHRLIIK
ncbi:MAG TPA: glycoside hydrolase family 3 C-terminal domain-containing protein [Chitinophagaceae bacterium]|nr:glycoside hydrolase family 3 C-terminal domain-containing protein [Chitinophagaceae bacterium]